MGPFRFRNLIIFTITFSLASPEDPIFYFLNNGTEQVKSFAFGNIYKYVNKIVIDMIHPYFVGYVDDNDRWETLSSDESHYPTAHLKFRWNIEKSNVNCTFSTNHGFMCDQVARLVVVEGKNMQYDLKVYGHDTYFERYIGCYESKKVNPEHGNIDDLGLCINYCNKRFFAVTKGKECLCIEDTRNFNPVGLHSCNETCKEFQFCGGSGYFSIYRRILKTKKSTELSWECIYHEINCSICPEGRYGPNCENRNCSLNNGDCEDLQCQTYDFRCKNCRCKICAYSISVCVCLPGYYAFKELHYCKDIDECIENPCPLNSRCINMAGAYECVCDKGFHLTDSNICIDTDECHEVIDACPNSTYCINTIGSYKCDCKDGYLTDGALCIDIDECLTTTCLENEICNNIIGSYSCDCLEGFEKSGGNNTCEDLDECLNNLDVCTNNTNCVNSIGSYDCKCKLGYYETPEKICADMDECNSTTTCDKESTECKNLLGDYECLCKIGFVKGESKSPKSRCFDIDECKPSRCPDGVSCINSLGSYDCLCPIGTMKKEFPHAMECQDIDECLQEGMCDETSSFCMNAFNYYICVCRVGYITIDNFTCIMTTAAKKVDLEEDTSSAVTTQSFDENEPKSEFIPWLAFILSFIIFFICGALCLYISNSYSEQSFSFMSTASSEFQSIG